MSHTQKLPPTSSILYRTSTFCKNIFRECRSVSWLCLTQNYFLNHWARSITNTQILSVHETEKHWDLEFFLDYWMLAQTAVHRKCLYFENYTKNSGGKGTACPKKKSSPRRLQAHSSTLLSALSEGSLAEQGSFLAGTPGFCSASCQPS